MKDVKVSVIMPMLNVEQYIRQCIESVINQTLKEIEILCVDAGSTDGTLEIIQEYAIKDNRIRIMNSPIKSYGHQMNMGIDASNGEYIAIVESDDYISDSMLNSLYNLNNGRNIDIIKSNFLDCYCDRTSINEDRWRMPSSQVVFKAYEYPTIFKGHPSIWSAIYRRQFLLDNNIRFIEAPGAAWVDNPFFISTLLKAEKICWIEKAYYYYRRDIADSSTNKIKDFKMPVRRAIDILEVLDKESNISDDIRYQIYSRAIGYLKFAEENAPFDSTNDEEFLNIISRLFSYLDMNFMETHFKTSDILFCYKHIYSNIFSAICNGLKVDEKSDYIRYLYDEELHKSSLKNKTDGLKWCLKDNGPKYTIKHILGIC